MPFDLGEPDWGTIIFYAISQRDFSEAMKEAYRKSEELLISLLTPRQREEYELQRGFTVICKSGRMYWIEYGRSYNVTLLGSDDVGFCAAPEDTRIPVYDIMLSQKLVLETNEDEFLKVANIQPDLQYLYSPRLDGPVYQWIR